MPHAFLLLLKHIVTITLFLLDRLTVLLLLANSHRTVPSERPTPKRSFFYYMQCMVLFSSLPLMDISLLHACIITQPYPCYCTDLFPIISVSVFLVETLHGPCAGSPLI